MTQDGFIKDFFISHTGADKDWALWIAWILEEAGYSTIVDAWDFPKGESFIDCMNEGMVNCKRMIVVASPEYWKANYTNPEWKYFFKRESESREIVMLLVEVRSSEVPPVISDKLTIVLSNIINERKAEDTLLQEIPKGIERSTSKKEKNGNPDHHSRLHNRKILHKGKFATKNFSTISVT